MGQEVVEQADSLSGDASDLADQIEDLSSSMESGDVGSYIEEIERISKELRDRKKQYEDSIEFLEGMMGRFEDLKSELPRGIFLGERVASLPEAVSSFKKLKAALADIRDSSSVLDSVIAHAKKAKEIIDAREDKVGAASEFAGDLASDLDELKNELESIAKEKGSRENPKRRRKGKSRR